jgi:Flp pilus assembly protein TadB
MSKQRARLRVAREAAAALRREEAQERERQVTASRRRRSSWMLRWRQLRLWRRVGGMPGRKDAWALLITLVLAVLVMTYLFTSSVLAVVFVLLVAIIAIPALAVVMYDRRH